MSTPWQVYQIYVYKPDYVLSGYIFEQAAEKCECRMPCAN